jgi:hypothetical protein
MNHNSFEEIPLFSKHKDIMSFMQYFKASELSVFLINLTVFITNNIYLLNNLDLFVAITFYNTEEDINEFGYVSPNIFISNHNNITFLTTDKQIDIRKHPVLGSYFKKLSYSDGYLFYKTVTEDKYGDIERIYMVKK